MPGGEQRRPPLRRLSAHGLGHAQLRERLLRRVRGGPFGEALASEALQERPEELRPGAVERLAGRAGNRDRGRQRVRGARRQESAGHPVEARELGGVARGGGDGPRLVAQPVERRLAARGEFRLQPLLDRFRADAFPRAALRLVRLQVLQDRADVRGDAEPVEERIVRRQAVRGGEEMDRDARQPDLPRVFVGEEHVPVAGREFERRPMREPRTRPEPADDCPEVSADDVLGGIGQIGRIDARSQPDDPSLPLQAGEQRDRLRARRSQNDFVEKFPISFQLVTHGGVCC